MTFVYLLTLNSIIHSANISSIKCLLNIYCSKHWICSGVVDGNSSDSLHGLN